MLMLAHVQVQAQIPFALDQPSAVGVMQPLLLPTDAGELTDHALSADGVLFVADRQTVWVRSPWGWERIWTNVTVAPGTKAEIHCLGVVEAADAGEALLIGTENGVWELRWERTKKGAHPWSPFVFKFGPARQLMSASGDVNDTNVRVTELLPLPGNAAGIRGLALASGGVSYSVVAQNGQLALGAPLFNGEVFQSVSAFAFSGGRSVCQEYPDGDLRFLSPSGSSLGSTDLASLLGSKTQLHAVLFDESRHLLLLGTGRGLLVSRCDAAGALVGNPEAVPALRGCDIRYLGWCAGRVLAVGNAPGGAPATGAVWWESRLAQAPVPTPSLTALADAMRFESAGAGGLPSAVKEVLQVAEDAFWAQTEDLNVFEWTPRQWRRLRPAEHGGLDQLSFWQAKPRTRAPVVVPDSLHHQIEWLVPRDARRWTRHEHDLDIAALVPDPSGEGFWSLDRAMPGLGATFHALRFRTRHGAFDTTDSIRYGNQPEVRDLRHFVALGAAFSEPATTGQYVFLPEASDGSLLLPSGADLIRAKAGEWRVLSQASLEGEGIRVEQLTPGAASADEAWLAVRRGRNSQAEVVAIDLNARGDGLAVRSTGLQASETATTRLVPDSTGHVWFAVKEAAGDWTLRRVRDFHELEGPLVLPNGEEPRAIVCRRPVMSVQGVLVSHTVDRFVFTDTGILRCEDDKPGEWTSILPPSANPAPHFADLQFEGDDAWLFTSITDIGGTSTPGPTYRVRWHGTQATLSPPESPSGASGASPSAVFPSNLTGVDTAFWSAPEAAPEQSWWYAAEHEPVLGVNMDDALLLPLRGLRSIVAAAENSRWEFRHGSPAGEAMFAVTDGRSLLMLPPPSPNGWESWPVPVPVDLSASRRDGTVVAWDMRSSFPPDPLPYDTVELVARFARDYDAWWETVPWRLRGRARVVGGGDAGTWRWADDAGVVRLPIEAGRNYVLEFESAQANGAKFQGIRTLPLSVAAPPTPPSPRLVAALVLLASTLAVVLLFVFSGAVRRAILRALGRRWVFNAPECDVTVEVREENGSVEWTVLRGGSVTVRDVLAFTALAQPAPKHRLEKLLPPAEGRLQTVSIRVPEELLPYPLGRWLVGGWASLATPQPEGARVAGQSAVLGQVLATPATHIRKVRFASVTFAGTPPLPVAAEILPIEHTFRRLRAEVLLSHSRCSDLIEALCEADIVHVAAHATLTAILLEDGAFTAGMLPDSLLARIRCRLLTLSACEAGGIASDRPSVAWPLIRAGTNIIGSTEPLDDTVARRFFPLLYERFLPVTAGEGPTLAEAIRAAAIDLGAALSFGLDTQWRTHLNLLVLYGNPNLRLAVFQPSENQRAH
jgi:hypothetical protein